MAGEIRKSFVWLVFCCAVGGLAVGCSDDTTETPKADTNTNIKIDTSSGIDKGVDAAQPTDSTTKEDSVIVEDASADGTVTFVDCAKESDGTNCSASGDLGFICLGGVCKASICGDKYVDTALNEECDDGNQDPMDGCSACHWICTDNSNCTDEKTCNGDETCNTTTHLCEIGTPLANGIACKMDSGADGECNGGVCGPAGCGNGVKAGTEECDDGNEVDGDGCNNDCTFSCHANTDCDDSDACNGVESCKMEADKQYCEAGVTPTCDDSKDCTTDSCDPASGCVYTPVDGDGDGKSCDDDCDDADEFVYVGAPECVDNKDNDCDKQVDEPPTTNNVTCYQDYDKDGYSYSKASTTTKFCGQPCDPGYTSLDPNVTGQADCGPCVADANPKQTGWFTKKYCTSTDCKVIICKATSFDYNCDGEETKHWNVVSKGCTEVKLGCTGSGWVTTVPACGISGDYRTCITEKLTGKCLTPSVQSRTQECH